MATVTIGKMDKRVTFRTVNKTEDDSKGNDEEYTDLLTTWAYVEDKGGSRNFLSSSDTVFDNKNIYVQYRAALSDLDKDVRILYNGIDYSIERSSRVDEKKNLIKFEAAGRQ